MNEITELRMEKLKKLSSSFTGKIAYWLNRDIEITKFQVAEMKVIKDEMNQIIEKMWTELNV